MGITECVATLAGQAQRAAQDRDEERAQHLADRYRALLLRHAPPELPQAQFLCILAAVLGRFARDMAQADPESLAEAMAELVRRHALGAGSDDAVAAGGA